MCRQPVCVVGDGNQTGPSAKDGNSTAGVVDRNAQKAVLCTLGRKSIGEYALELLARGGMACVKTKVPRVLCHAALPQSKPTDFGKPRKGETQFLKPHLIATRRRHIGLERGLGNRL